MAHLLEHPKILIVKHSGAIREVFMLHNGIFNMVKLKPQLRPTSIASKVDMKRGWFDSIYELEEFILEFNRIMNDNTRVSTAEMSFFMKVKSNETALPSYFSTAGLNRYTAIDNNTFNLLQNLIRSPKIVLPKPRSRNTGDGIWLSVKHNKPAVRSELFIHPNGDIDLTTRTPNSAPITLQKRTTTRVFNQLEEVVAHNKHVKPLKILYEENDLDFINEFDLQYFFKGKEYYVQQCTVDQGGEHVVMTNEYKKDTIKKIMKIVDSVLFDKAIELPLYEGIVTSAPPVFAGYQLIRLPHYKMPVDEDLPSVIAIKVTVKSNKCFTLDLQSNLPLAEIIAFFREVESKMDFKSTKPCCYSIHVGESERIKQICVYSLKSIDLIYKLPMPLIIKVWDMLVRATATLSHDTDNKR